MGANCIDNNHDPVYAGNFESSSCSFIYTRLRSCLQLIVFGTPRLSSWLATSTRTWSEAPPSQILILSISLKAQLSDNRCPIRLWVSLLFSFETSSTDLWSAPTFPVAPNPSVDVPELAQSTVSNPNTLIHVIMLTSLRHSTDGDFISSSSVPHRRNRTADFPVTSSSVYFRWRNHDRKPFTYQEG